MRMGPMYSSPRVGLLPNLTGWLRGIFPWSEDKMRGVEWLNVCPPCAEDVAKFIAHKKKPMLGDEDLIG